eukprot:COSAG01_NODE_18780_length_1053_cov_4.887153_2_plen_154_part_00
MSRLFLSRNYAQAAPIPEGVPGAEPEPELMVDPEGDEGGAGIEVTFSETRPLGITWVKWSHTKSGDEAAAIKTIKPTGQGAACGKLKPGLLLATVGGQEGLHYTEQMAAIQVLVCVKYGVHTRSLVHFAPCLLISSAWSLLKSVLLVAVGRRV